MLSILAQSRPGPRAVLDRAAIVDLVRTVLAPLQDTRGGAQPLLDTLTAYCNTGAPQPVPPVPCT